MENENRVVRAYVDNAGGIFIFDTGEEKLYDCWNRISLGTGATDMIDVFAGPDWEPDVDIYDDPEAIVAITLGPEVHQIAEYDGKKLELYIQRIEGSSSARDYFRVPRA